MPQFYLPSSGTPSISPPFSASWNITTDADRVLGQMASTSNHTLISTGQQSFTSVMADKVINTPTASSAFVLARQFVYDPTTAPLRTLLSNARCSIRVQESDALINATLAVGIFLVSQDLTPVTVMAVQSVSTESVVTPTAATSRQMNVNPNANLSFVPGSRWVVEIGCKLASSTAAGTVTFRFGWLNGSDLNQDDVSTGDLNPWVSLRGASDVCQDGVNNNNYQSIRASGLSVSGGIR